LAKHFEMRRWSGMDVEVLTKILAMGRDITIIFMGAVVIALLLTETMSKK
jgi:hypothetical protein